MSVCLSLSMRLSAYLSDHLSIYLSFLLSFYFLATWQADYLTIDLSIYRPTFQSINLSFWNEAIMRDFLLNSKVEFGKSETPARLPQKVHVRSSDEILRDFLNFLNLTTSKTKQFCKTSFKMESWVQSWQPRTNAFCDFPLRLPRKSEARSYELLRVSRNHVSKPEDVRAQNATPLRTSMSAGYVSCTAPATRKCILTHSSNAPRLPSFLKLQQDLQVWLTFEQVKNPLRLPHQTTPECQEVTSKMCFAGAFQQINVQKCSENGVLCAFWLRNVLRATAECNFSSLLRPDGSAPAALANLLFDPPEPQSIGKTQCSATFRPFDLLSTDSFSSDSFSSRAALTSVAASVHESEVWLLNFLRSSFANLKQFWDTYCIPINNHWPSLTKDLQSCTFTCCILHRGILLSDLTCHPCWEGWLVPNTPQCKPDSPATYVVMKRVQMVR